METKKICKRCNVEKEISRFKIIFDKRYNKNRIYNICKECDYNNIGRISKKEKKEKEDLELKNGIKICRCCKQTKKLNEFYFREDIKKYRAECIECFKKQVKFNYQKEEVKLKIKLRKQSLKYKLKRKAYESQPEIKEKRRLWMKQWRHNNYEHYSDWRKKRMSSLEFKAKRKAYRKLPYVKIKEREYEKFKMKTDIKYKLRRNIKAGIYSSLKKGKNGNSWEKLVGYTTNDLKQHLEKQFDKNMNWNNYGNFWEIDHILPISYFKFQSYNDEEFKKCWALNNLRPLEKSENRSKGSKIIKELVA